MSWPDLHFHTQFLTADMTDPRVFRRAGVTTALAAYEIADADENDALAIAAEVAARAEFRLAGIASRARYRLAGAARGNGNGNDADVAGIAARARSELAYAAARDRRAVASVTTLVAGAPSSALALEIAAHDDRLREGATRAMAQIEVRSREEEAAISTSRPLDFSTSLQTVVRRRHEGPGSALSGTSYPELIDLVERMQARDPRVIFDSLRPMGDEIWNMIDGERTFGEIVEAVCLEFGFDLPPEHFLPLLEGLGTSDAVDVARVES
jgi:hypothetical protein